MIRSAPSLPAEEQQIYITNDFSNYLGIMKLFFRASGNGQPLIILHGLFGSSDNWYSLAKVFAQTYEVYVVDQRNHGQSPHDADINYKLLTEDLFEFLMDHGLAHVRVIGHSMGGKTAMNFAVKYPGYVDRLVVVDIVPKAYPMRHDSIVTGLKAIPLDSLHSRNEAESILTPYVPEAAERQFLLKNLERKPGGGFGWKLNLKALEEHMEELGKGMEYGGHFDKPTLFIKGARSTYFGKGDEDEIRIVFPNAQFKTLNTGHWVQAENPQEFAQTVLAFLHS